jgi:sugar phosphate isomerase/epimerase
MNTFSVSMNCYTWGTFDIAQCLEQIAKTPVRNVELPVEQFRPGSLIPEIMVDETLGGDWRHSIADLKALLDRDGFTVESLDVFGAFQCRRGADIIRRRIDFAEELGAETIVLGCGPEDDDETRVTLYSLLREMGDYAATKGVRIALEIHGGIMANAAEALRTMDEVARENVGINFDTANILFYNPEADGPTELAACAEHVSHVHLKDIIRGATRKEHVLPRLGQGEVDFRQVFDILHAADFYGPFSFEVETFHGATARDADISAYQEDLVASMQYIASLGEMDGA